MRGNLDYPRILIIAGSDSGGGAGIQADIKTVTMLGGFAMTAITAITAQNTLGVQAIHPIPPAMIGQQISAVMEDIGADVIKIGMLGDSATIYQVAASLRSYADKIPVVLDPVMQAKGGASLLQEEARTALIEALLPLASIVTPNIPEAEALTGLSLHNETDMQRAAAQLHAQCNAAILVKGGHLAGATLVNLLYEAPDAIHITRTPRIDSAHTHGTGCTLASALATAIGQGLPLTDALAKAERYVQRAIQQAPQFGAGHGPMRHNVTKDAPMQRSTA